MSGIGIRPREQFVKLMLRRAIVTVTDVETQPSQPRSADENQQCAFGLYSSSQVIKTLADELPPGNGLRSAKSIQWLCYQLYADLARKTGSNCLFIFYFCPI